MAVQSDRASATSTTLQPSATSTRESWRKLGSGLGLAAAIHVGGVGANLVSNVALAQWLGQESYGQYVLLLSVSLILGVLAAAGLPLAALRIVPQQLSSNSPGTARWSAERLWSLALKVAIGVVAGGVLVSLSSVTAPWLLSPVELLSVTLLGVLIALSNFQLELARALRDLVLAYVPQKIGWPALVGLIAAGGMLADRTASATAAALLVAGILAALTVAQARIIRRRLATLSSTVQTDRQLRWTKVAAPMWGISIGATLLATIDVVALGWVVGEAELATYYAAKRLSMFVVFASFAANAYAAPRIAGLYHTGGINDLQDLLTRCARITFVSSISFALALVVLREPLLRMFGEGFMIAATPFVCLALAQVVNGSNGVVGSLLTVAGLQRTTAALTAGAAVAEGLACLAAGATGGISAAAAAVLAMAVLRNVAMLALGLRTMGVNASVLPTGLLQRG